MHDRIDVCVLRECNKERDAYEALAVAINKTRTQTHKTHTEMGRTEANGTSNNLFLAQSLSCKGYGPTDYHYGSFIDMSHAVFPRRAQKTRRHKQRHAAEPAFEHDAAEGIGE